MKAAIIAGGKGTRIRELTSDTIPKAMLPVAGLPIIFRQLRLLARYGVSQVAIMTGHLAHVLREKLPDEAKRLGITPAFFHEPVPLGSAGGFYEARDFLDEDFFVLYCDVAIEMDLALLSAFHSKKKADATIVCHPNDHPYESDLLLTDAESRIRNVIYKKDRRDGYYPNLVPAGVYCFSKRVFDRILQNEKQDFIRDIFPRMIKNGDSVYAYSTPEYLRDMGTCERFKMVEADILSGFFYKMNASNKRPAIFFDRDGVLCKQPFGKDILRHEDLEMESGACEALKAANDAGVLSVVATNQPMIAKGFMTFDDLALVHAKLETILGQNRVKIDRIYFCPHHPDKGFDGEVTGLKMDCDCRKPGAGMILKACDELPIALSESCFIGDSFRDIGAARKAGIDAFGVRTGAACRDCSGEYRPDAIFANVLEAVNYFLSGINNAAPVADEVIKRLGVQNRITVGVCGIARAGKTTLTHALSNQLEKRGISTLKVRLDDWIVPKSERNQNMCSEDRSQVRLYPRLLEELLAGREICGTGYEQVTREASCKGKYKIEGERVVILDGLYACHSSIRDKIGYAIFVDCDGEALTSRFLEFYAWKGESKGAIDDLLSERMKEEWPSVLKQKAGCDIIIKALTEERTE